jgi:hypothetical protein
LRLARFRSDRDCGRYRHPEEIDALDVGEVGRELEHDQGVGPRGAVDVAARGGPMASDHVSVPLQAVEERRAEPSVQPAFPPEPRTLAIMHGSSFSGDGAGALRRMAHVYAEIFGVVEPTRG